jgi:microcystin-dependent protein
MASPFLGEIRIFSFAFAPKGWALANGQTMPIQQNQALFALLGTTYGGNGQTTFALPNLQGRVAMSFNGNHPQGQSAGEASHTLTIQETPTHTHVPNANDAIGTQASPAGAYWANDSNQNATFGSTPTVTLNSAAIGNAGGSQPHSNMMPYLTLSFCIALQGIFPSQN